MSLAKLTEDVATYVRHRAREPHYPTTAPRDALRASSQALAELYVAPDGTVRAIYSDQASPLLRGLGGEHRIARASHVEPDDQGLWVADMSPVGGPRLEPCATRSEALAAEVAWLRAHGVPVPR